MMITKDADGCWQKLVEMLEFSKDKINVKFNGTCVDNLLKSLSDLIVLSPCPNTLIGFPTCIRYTPVEETLGSITMLP